MDISFETIFYSRHRRIHSAMHTPIDLCHSAYVWSRRNLIYNSSIFQFDGFTVHAIEYRKMQIASELANLE